MKIFVTGGSGFIGSHLVKKLRTSGNEVFAPDLKELNFQSPESIENAVERGDWDVVVHLGAMSNVVDCENKQLDASEINVRATTDIISVLKAEKSRCHFIFASTAQVYRAPEGDEILNGVVFDESRELSPQNFYAKTKLEAENQIPKKSRDFGMRSTILRLFNHTHKSQSPNFFMPHIFNQLQSGRTEIPVGNLDLDRDIGAVSDLVDAFVAVIQKTDWRYEVFNVCSGYPKNLRTLADLMAKKMNVPAQFILDKSRLRDGEPKKLVGSHAKLTERTGWRPKIKTEEDLVESFLCE